MNTRLSEVISEIGTTEKAIHPLMAKLQKLTAERRKLESLAFIEANKIRRADVEMSSGDGKPYFGVVHAFADWIKSHGTKNWAEWNGRIYHTHDLIQNRMPDMPGQIDDLKN